MRPASRNGLLVFLLIVSAGIFVARGPVRAVRAGPRINDFLSPYLQSKAWLMGVDPYDVAAFSRFWPTEAGSPSFFANGKLVAAKFGIPSPYPITAFPLLSPLSGLPWRAADLVWLFVVLISFLGALYTTIRLAGFHHFEEKGWLVIAALVLAPFHTAVATENAVLPVFALAAGAVLLAQEERLLGAVFLLTPALALKPTVAAPFAIYLLLRWQWRVLVSAAMGTASILLLAHSRLAAAGSPWLASFFENSRLMFGPGGVDDFSAANPLRFNLLNLQVVTFQIFGTRTIAQVAAWMIFGLLFAAWLWCMRGTDGSRETGNRTTGLLDLSLAATLTLLPFYHRFYDAVLLLLPLSWAITNFHGDLRRYARACLILTAVFLLPGPALMERLLEGSRLSWSTLLASHEVCAVLLLAVVLLAARFKASGAEFREPGMVFS